jgi:transposase-like protein
VFITIDGKRHYLWRAVDQDGYVLDILVQDRRHKHTAKRIFRKLLKGLQHVRRVIVTDKLRCYGAAHKEILPGVEHRRTATSITVWSFRTKRHDNRQGMPFPLGFPFCYPKPTGAKSTTLSSAP